MFLRMANPWKHPQTGIYYFRERPPAALQGRLRGEQLGLSVDGQPVSVRVGSHIKVSLRTKEASLARTRYRSVSEQISGLVRSFGDEGFSLTAEQTAQLAAEWYRELVAKFRANPGDAEGWSVHFDDVAEALAHFVPDDDPDHAFNDPEFIARGGRPPYDPARGEALVRDHLKPDQFLQARGLRLAPASRSAFLRAAGIAHLDATRLLRQFAEGDYTPDRRAAERYAQEPFKHQSPIADADIWTLFDAWAKENGTPETIAGFRFNIMKFVDHVGHTDARRFARRDVRGWKDAMVAEGLPVKTINNARLAALKAVLNHAADNEAISTNPAARITAGGRAKGKGERRMLGFSDREATAILTAAVKDSRPVIRWVPLLCAVTGARVSEMMQLRKEDVAVEGGMWTINISPDAGRLKNAPSERRIPLHPCLIGRGFLQFVRGRPDGHLFFNDGRRRTGSKAKPGKGAVNHLREFIHTVAKEHGLKVGRDHRKDPNHAWRHRFTTLAREHSMDPEKREFMLGHALAGEAGIYGGMAGLLVEVCKLPDPLSGNLCDPKEAFAGV